MAGFVEFVSGLFRPAGTVDRAARRADLDFLAEAEPVYAAEEQALQSDRADLADGVMSDSERRALSADIWTREQKHRKMMMNIDKAKHRLGTNWEKSETELKAERELYRICGQMRDLETELKSSRGASSTASGNPTAKYHRDQLVARLDRAKDAAERTPHFEPNQKDLRETQENLERFDVQVWQPLERDLSELKGRWTDLRGILDLEAARKLSQS